MFRAGFVIGYLAALATCGAALARLALRPPSAWWRQ